jgi:hypothetical protein
MFQGGVHVTASMALSSPHQTFTCLLNLVSRYPCFSFRIKERRTPAHATGCPGLFHGQHEAVNGCRCEPCLANATLSAMHEARRPSPDAVHATHGSLQQPPTDVRTAIERWPRPGRITSGTSTQCWETGGGPSLENNSSRGSAAPCWAPTF